MHWIVANIAVDGLDGDKDDAEVGVELLYDGCSVGGFLYISGENLDPRR